MITSRKVRVCVAGNDGDILLVVAHRTIILMLVVLQPISCIYRCHGFLSEALTINSLISFGTDVIRQCLLANGHIQTNHILVVRSGH